MGIVRTNVPEERVASIIRVERLRQLRTSVLTRPTLRHIPEDCILHMATVIGSHNVTSQKKLILILKIIWHIPSFGVNTINRHGLFFQYEEALEVLTLQNTTHCMYHMLQHENIHLVCIV
jgi:hypothetical protein